MRRISLLHLLLVPVAALLLSAAALGNAGLDQYKENVPKAGGGNPDENQDDGKAKSPTGTENLGPEPAPVGAASAQSGATKATSDQDERSSKPTKNNRKKTESPEAKDNAATAHEDSAEVELLAADSGGTGFGMGTPLVMAAMLIVAVALAIARRVDRDNAGKDHPDEVG